MKNEPGGIKISSTWQRAHETFTSHLRQQWPLPFPYKKKKINKNKKTLNCAYLATPACPFAPPSTCVGFRVRPAACLHWRLLHRHLTDRCFPEK